MSHGQKSYIELTKRELEKRSSLTSVEQDAVLKFLEAALVLPKRLCISMDDDDHELIIYKRTTRGSAIGVGKIKKKSLFF